jgi:hypothetical protein
MPGAVKDTPHATMIWKGTERNIERDFTEPAGSCDATDDIIAPQPIKIETTPLFQKRRSVQVPGSPRNKKTEAIEHYKIRVEIVKWQSQRSLGSSRAL